MSIHLFVCTSVSTHPTICKWGQGCLRIFKGSYCRIYPHRSTVTLGLSCYVWLGVGSCLEVTPSSIPVYWITFTPSMATLWPREQIFRYRIRVSRVTQGSLLGRLSQTGPSIPTLPARSVVSGFQPRLVLMPGTWERMMTRVAMK
jgi:hypothetical protein